MQIPGYKIIDTLGEGGMARVYLAIQESFEREVALKVLDPHLCSRDPTFGERFLREARIVSRLVHPNIVTVYDVGVHRGHHFLSMEYVPGRDLKHRRFELSLYESIGVIKDVARALDYAGRKGCVHRDVKPDNIMLHAEDGRAVLMDFGIARIVDQASSMTETGTTVGTPHYMSPEHARGATVDGRSDLYSLGVVLFLLLTGYLPYDSDSAVAIGVMHISDAIPRLPEHLAVLQPLMDRVLAKSPDDRVQSGGELLQALEAIDRQTLDALEREGERRLVQPVDGESPTWRQAQWLGDPTSDASSAAYESNLSGDYLAVDDDDRIGREGTPESRPSGVGTGRLVGIAMLLIALLAGAGYYGGAYSLRHLWEPDKAVSSGTGDSTALLSESPPERDVMERDAPPAFASGIGERVPEASPMQTPDALTLPRPAPRSEGTPQTPPVSGSAAEPWQDTEPKPEPELGTEPEPEPDPEPSRIEPEPGPDPSQLEPEPPAAPADTGRLPPPDEGPVIELARISATPLRVLYGEQPKTLPSTRVLYAGFTYRNFGHTSRVIQAILYDGSRQLQIALVPVVVQNDTGQTFFRLERPVTGFVEGGYHLELRAGETVLAHLAFQVESG